MTKTQRLARKLALQEDATPYESGWSAADCGLSLRDNPFQLLTGDAMAWRNGWCDMLRSVGLR